MPDNGSVFAMRRPVFAAWYCCQFYNQAERNASHIRLARYLRESIGT